MTWGRQTPSSSAEARARLGSREADGGAVPLRRLSILVVPASDWLRHPFLTRMHYLFEKMAKRHWVSVLEISSPTFTAKRDTEATILEVRTPRSDDLAVANLLSLPSTAIVVAQAMKRRHFDVVVSSNIIPGLVAFLLARLMGVPCILDYHDHIPDSASLYYSGAKKRLVRAAVWGICLLSVRMSRKVVCSSASLAKIVAQEFHAPQKTIIIPNGYDSEVFAPAEDGGNALEGLGLEDLADKFRVVFAGSLEDRYDFLTVLSAIDSLDKKGSRISLIIIGKGISSEFESRLRTQCSAFPFVRFIGYIPDILSVAKYLNLADACIAPYKIMKTNYGLTLKIMEYLAVGKPVLVTPIPEVLARVGNCVLVYRSSEELEKELNLLSSDRALSLSLARCGMAYVRDLSWEKLAKNYEQLLLKLNE